MKTRLLTIITGILVLSLFIIVDNSEIKYAYGGCVATILPQPCFDSFMGSHEPMTQKSIMENFARYIELNFGEWQMSDRKWDNANTPLQLPAIICTEFVADGMRHYRMAEWADPYRISSFEDHRNDFLCNKWLAPIDDGVKIRWDKPRYLANDVGIVTVTDKENNLDHKKQDSFDIHVWSDTDHTGIQLTITETEIDNGIFEGTVFLTTEGKSEGTRLLVEDAVYAEHKSSVHFVRITNELSEDVLDESHVNDFQDTKNPNDCKYQDDDGNILPCTMGNGIDVVGMFFVVFWPYVILGIVISAVFIVWRIRK
ncbi:hypothetical protein [Nitrosarchaeum sp. AC2]|uniref:hypothetical protein n=1 Tax=Nitrosarchaeum sp. AC2 TaxID=2259673 RepID=UPI0015CEE492|nr:hypothetical protein [Nitrosarchaeum sp. AC2]QLH10856.1 hypothetical protein DSQ20_04745 [Nitrosarchaeum sp. AC2]